MADFIKTLGFLTVAEDLGWRRRYPGEVADTTILPKAYLRGSDRVNDVCIAVDDPNEIVVYATDAGLSFVICGDGTGDLGAVDMGYATLSGGFTKVCAVGDYVYAVSKTNPDDIYRLDVTALSPASDNTPGGWSPYINQAGGVVFTDIYGGTPNGTEMLGLCWTAGGNAYVGVRFIATATDYYTQQGNSGGSGGHFPSGDHGDDLYWCRGSQVHRLIDMHTVSANNWKFTHSYGRFLHQFPGTTQDADNIYAYNSGNMTGCYDFTTADKVTFSTTCTSGDSAGYCEFLGHLVGECNANLSYSLDSIPTGVEGTAEVGIELYSEDGQTVIRVAHKLVLHTSGDPDETYEGTLIVGGVDETPASWQGITPVGSHSGTIGVDRSVVGFAATTYDISLPGMATFQHERNFREDTPLKARAFVKIDTGGTITGEFTGIGSLYTGPAGYISLPLGDIAASAVSEVYADGKVGLALAHTRSDGNDYCSYLLFDAGDPVLYTDWDQIATGAASGDRLVPNIAAAAIDRGSSHTSALMIFGGDNGAVAYEVNTATPSTTFKRHFTEAWSHAQPLTGLDVLCLEYGEFGFAYGCDVSTLYSEFHGASGDTYDPGSGAGGSTTSGAAPSGGGGYIHPDFTGSIGTTGAARALNSAAIAVEFLHPSPLPDDYMHAHLERSTDGGTTWKRFQHDGDDFKWTTLASPWTTHDDDVVFNPDETTGYENVSAGTVNSSLTTGKYQYRWVFQDEAGNEEILPAATYYGATEYLDTPVIGSVTINDGETVTSYAATFTMTGTSGSTTAVTDAIHQVKAWQDGTSESAAIWQDYSAGKTFFVLLSGSDGLKTVNVKARHVSGQEASTTVNCTLALCQGQTSPTFDFEPVMMTFGNSEYAFSSDPYEISETGGDDEVTASDFPLANLQVDDPNVRWRSKELGDWDGGTVSGDYITKKIAIQVDFDGDEAIGLVGLVGHNFNSSEIQSFIGGDGYLYLTIKGLDAEGSVVNTYTIGDIYNAYPIILHRPQSTAASWRVEIEVKARSIFWAGYQGGFYGFYSSSTVRLEIGRLFFQRTSDLWQATYNPEQGIRSSLQDTSVVSRTKRGGKRSVEDAVIETLKLDWGGNSILPEADYRTLRAVFEEKNKSIRPVVFIKDPHRVHVGISIPPQSNYTAIYGYLDAKFDYDEYDFGSRRHAEATLEIEQAAGVSSD